MFALWIAVTFFRPCRRACSKANCAMRVDARSVMIFRLSTTPGHDLVLEAGVEILGVLADDDQVDALEPRVDAGQVPHRPQVRVEIERLAQPDVDAREALRRSASSPVL